MGKGRIKHNFTEQEITEKIVNFKEVYNRTPTMHEVWKLLGCNFNFKDKFNKTYVEFLIENVGESKRKRGINSRNYKWSKMSDEELIKLYKNFCDEIGRVVVPRDLKENKNYPSYNIYTQRFESLKRVRELAGIEINEPRFNIDRKRFTKLEIMKTLKEKYRENNRRLTVVEIMDSKEIPCIVTLNKYFKTNSINKIWKLVEQEIYKENSNKAN